MNVRKITDGEATAYTVAAVLLDPDEHEELDRLGYRSPTALYVVFTGGTVLGADHDPHRLGRELGARWITDHLIDLGSEVEP